jgi:hypothetical protein
VKSRSGQWTLEEIESAILTSSGYLGWRGEVVAPGQIVLTKAWSAHSATVEVAFDLAHYSIHYKNSVNLDYDGQRIHRRYNAFVTELNRSIQAELYSPGSAKLSTVTARRAAPRSNKLTAGAVSSWHKPGATSQILTSDRNFCVNKSNRWAVAGAGAAANAPGYALLGLLASNYDFNHCMEELGWSRLENTHAAQTQQLVQLQNEFANFGTQYRSILPTEPFCAMPGMISPDLTVLRLSTATAHAGFKPGDRLLALDQSRILDFNELLGELLKRKAGQRMTVTFEREGSESDITMICSNGQPIADSILAVADAGARGDWAGCLPHLTELERLSTVGSPTARFRLTCYEADRISRNRPLDLEAATLVYAAAKLTLEESQLQWRGAVSARASALIQITWLEANGYPTLAEDLKRLAYQSQ